MDWHTFFLDNWHVKLVIVLLIVAAYIDGRQLRVPNWLTFPMVLSGLLFNLWIGGWAGFGAGLLGLGVGLACLLPMYAVGGMGAGDVKLLGGVGAWLGAGVTFSAFCVSAIVGAVMAVGLMLYRRRLHQHYANAVMILTEWMHVRDPKRLSELAAERKASMLLLPYGIPICVGCIAYFFYAGLI